MGLDHPYTATFLNDLAELYSAQGRYAEAEPLYKRSLAIVENALGPEHPKADQALEYYAVLLRETGHPGDHSSRASSSYPRPDSVAGLSTKTAQPVARES